MNIQEEDTKEPATVLTPREEDEFQTVGIDLSALIAPAVFNTGVSQAAIDKVIEDAKMKHPSVDFDPLAIELRRKFEARVDGQIERANANIRKWQRSKGNVVALKPIDNLLVKLYQEEKINESMKRAGFDGVLPPPKKRKSNKDLIEQGYQQGYIDGSDGASSTSGGSGKTVLMPNRKRIIKRKKVVNTPSPAPTSSALSVNEQAQKFIDEVDKTIHTHTKHKSHTNTKLFYTGQKRKKLPYPHPFAVFYGFASKSDV